MMRLFRRPKAAAPVPPESELARRLTDPDYACACCSTVLRASTGVIHPAAPFGWSNPPPPRPDAEFTGSGRELLTENYARHAGDNLIRAYLPIPVKGTDASVFIGVWCSLKTGNHALFRAAQEQGDADRLGDMFSWLYTQLPRLTGPLLTKGIVAPYSKGRRPVYWITEERHPFYAAQQQGLMATEILALYEDFGHGEVVSHLKA